MKSLVVVFIAMLWLGMAIGNVGQVQRSSEEAGCKARWSDFVVVVVAAPVAWAAFSQVPDDQPLNICKQENL